MGINEYIQIGSRIKQLRNKKGISQKDMASMIGIPVSTYSNYENNYREPSLELIYKICAVLQINIDLLFGYTKEVFQTERTYRIAQKINLAGYDTETFENDDLLICYPNEECLRLSKEECLELDKLTNSYLKFKLEELKQKHMDDVL